jgi:uncharacterized protein YkwD
VTETRPPRRLTTPAILPRMVSGLLAAALALGVAASASGGSTGSQQPDLRLAATTATFDPAVAKSMSSQILSSLNRDRVAHGLRAIQPWGALATVATERAGRMAASQTLSHTAAGGNVGVALTSAGIQWYSFGEIIGMTSYAWGGPAASNLYSMWLNSPVHHAIMFSASYNYAGVGIVRAADGTTWASVVFSESVDHTRPVARNGYLTARGTRVHFTWSGRDIALQTHTAGLRGFYVQYRVDNGAWHTIRSNTTATALTLYNRPHHHSYSFRVRSADRRGNLSAWTAAKRIWVP